MRICERWAVTPERIREYLLEEEKLNKTGEDSFSDGKVTVCLEPLPPRTLGSFTFPQTQVVFDGGDGETQERHRRFVLRFLSGGG